MNEFKTIVTSFRKPIIAIAFVTVVVAVLTSQIEWTDGTVIWKSYFRQ